MQVKVLGILGVIVILGMGYRHSPHTRFVSAKATDCIRNSGWTYQRGELDMQLAANVQLALGKHHQPLTIVAQQVGEADDCGTFIMQSMDIIVQTDAEFPHTFSQMLFAQLLYKALSEQVTAPLGNITILSPDASETTRYLMLNEFGHPELASALSSSRQIFPSSSVAALPSEMTIQRNVLVISYNPLLSNGKSLIEHRGWYDHQELTQDTIDFFATASNGRLQYKIAEEIVVQDGWPEKIDGFVYTEAEYLGVLNGTVEPHRPDNVNYNKIVNDPEFDICGRASRGEIDEVWIYNGPYFGFYESTLVGPGSYWFNSPPVPAPWDCNRMISIMGPNPERHFTVHNFGHRMESTMAQVYGSWVQNSTEHGWDTFSLVDALAPDYSYSGCGNIHYPPNGQSDYDYSNSTNTAQTNCADFVNYPTLTKPLQLATVDCTVWGCTEVGFEMYWYSNLPANSGCDKNYKLNDWWLYFAYPELAVSEADCFVPPIDPDNFLYLPMIHR